MACRVYSVRLLGFHDFFPEEKNRQKDYYATKLGKELIETFCCYMLSYSSQGGFPPIVELFKSWFSYMGRPYMLSPGYNYFYDKYSEICSREPERGHSILSEEAILNLFLWTKTNSAIPMKAELMDASATIDIFFLNLLFNDDQLHNYQKAVDSASRYSDRVPLRMLLAISFPQNDIINVDYAQLLITQYYKLILLFDFLENTPSYQAVFRHLLNDFSSGNKKEFLRAIEAAVFIPFKRRTPGCTALMIENISDIGKSKFFLDKLTLNEADASTDQNDYLALRDKPFQKLDSGDYRIIFDLFLIKKLYNGIIFKLSDYCNKDEKLMKGFLSKIRDEFSEAVLVYNILSKIFQTTGAVTKTGKEFKSAGLKREPDFYARIGNNILLFESKDFYMLGTSKLSYDFDIIVGELKKDGRLEKAVKQLKENITRAIAKQLILDKSYDPLTMKIYPVIIVHDSLYSCASLNYWVNSWLEDEILTLRAAGTFSGLDFSRIMPVTLVEIDTLILYLSHFQNKQIDFLSLLDLYHKYVKLDLEEVKIDEQIFQSVLPFSEFVREYGYKIGLTINSRTLVTLKKKYGIE